MHRPRTILLLVVTLLTGAALSGIGEAQADNSTTTTAPATPATIVVNGTATLSAPPDADSATQQSTYMTALGDAISNAASKASAVASQIDAALGSIENVTETSDSSGDLCGGWVEPLQADAGRPTTTTATPSASGSKKKKNKKADVVRRAGPAVIVADPSMCSIEADVTVTYDMTPASA
jgi:uncharacterized protein YggE